MCSKKLICASDSDFTGKACLFFPVVGPQGDDYVKCFLGCARQRPMDQFLATPCSLVNFRSCLAAEGAPISLQQASFRSAAIGSVNQSGLSPAGTTVTEASITHATFPGNVLAFSK